MGHNFSILINAPFYRLIQCLINKGKYLPIKPNIHYLHSFPTVATYLKIKKELLENCLKMKKTLVSK